MNMKPEILIYLGISLIITSTALFILRYLKGPGLPQNLEKLFEDAEPGILENSVQWDLYLRSSSFPENYQEITSDPTYCEKVAEYRKTHPIRLDERGLPIQQDRIFFLDFPHNYYIYQVLSESYTLVLPGYYYTNFPTNRPLTAFPLNITIFYTMVPTFHNEFKINYSFLCKGQIYNHIPGNVFLDYKDQNALDFRVYSDHYSGRKHCFQLDQSIPHTLVLNSKTELDLFMVSLQESISNTEIRWIYKKARNSNRGQGVTLVTQALAKQLLRHYKTFPNSKKHSNYIAQRYISDPFLTDGHKFDLRTYMFIASMDPLIVLYHDGFLRRSIKPYNISSPEPVSHITNVAIAKKYLSSQGITEDLRKEALESSGWSFPMFEQYLITNHYVKENWMKTSLKPQLKQLSFHVLRMNLKRLLKQPRIFELFGLDFILKSDLSPMFLELNYDPGLATTTKDRAEMNKKLLMGIVELEYSLEYNPDVFDEILAETQFEWIFDGRKTGHSRYHGLLLDECL